MGTTAVSTDPEFDDLMREFLIEADSKIREITSLLEPDGSGTAGARERMIYLAHQLKGAGGSYGFPSISSDAAALESALEKMGQGGSPELHREIEGRLQKLNHVIESRLRELSAK
jgi:HPt (histidine-containing phosphotransfer) domain-containing protein